MSAMRIDDRLRLVAGKCQLNELAKYNHLLGFAVEDFFYKGG